MIDDEDQILAAAIGALGAGSGGLGGGRAATFAAKRLKKNVHEIGLSLAMPLDAAAAHVAAVLARAGHLLDAEDTRPTGARAVRAVVGGGYGSLNPVLITVGLSEDGPERTTVSVRGAAKEGLIKQRAGEKTAKRIAELLARQGMG